jgi:hypothetical protein
MASRRILLQLGSGILVFQVLAAGVAIAANWPAQFGGVGTDAGAEALTRGTALSAPLVPLAVFAVGLVCLWRGATRSGAAICSVVALAILAGSLGEAFAPATADVPKAVLIASGVIGTVLAVAILVRVPGAWRESRSGAASRVTAASAA